MSLRYCDNENSWFESQDWPGQAKICFFCGAATFTEKEYKNTRSIREAKAKERGMDIPNISHEDGNAKEQHLQGPEAERSEQHDTPTVTEDGKTA